MKPPEYLTIKNKKYQYISRNMESKEQYVRYDKNGFAQLVYLSDIQIKVILVYNKIIKDLEL